MPPTPAGAQPGATAATSKPPPGTEPPTAGSVTGEAAVGDPAAAGPPAAAPLSAGPLSAGPPSAAAPATKPPAAETPTTEALAGEGAATDAPNVNWVERLVRRADRYQQQHAVIGFPWAVMQKFGNDQAGAKAALMAYYGFFALFPLLLLLATILGFVLSGQPHLRDQVINSALGNFPVIGTQLRSDVHPLEGSLVGLGVGIGGTLYGSLGIGFAAQNAMNTVWNIPYVHWPNIWKRYLRTFGTIGLLGLACLASTALATFTTAVANGPGTTLAGVVASGAVNFGLFLLAFKVLTAVKLPTREVVLGAAVATVLWEALQMLGTWYVARALAHATPTYGFFAVVIALLSWLALGAQLTLWAAEINVVRHYRLWPRSITQPPLTEADRRVFKRLARMEVRRPEVKVRASFTEQADEDPLDGPA